MQATFRSMLILATISILYLRCSSDDVDVPGPLAGVWVEDSVKNDGPNDSKVWEKSNGTALLRFEKMGKKANVFRGNVFDPVANRFSWSDSFALKSAGKNAWTFKFENRKVSLKMNKEGHLIVNGLFMRSYNQDIIKRNPEPVEMIFVKKE